MGLGPGFRIVEGSSGVPSRKWFPVSYVGGAAQTVYVGQLVKLVDGDGVAPLPNAAAGPAVIYPFGIITALNKRTPTYDSTYKTNYGISVASQADELARDYFGAEGMTGKGEPALMAKVALIEATSVIEGPVMKTAYGTAPGILTMTTGSAAGLTGFVHNTADSTLVTLNNMYYCRSGLNAGLYRSSYAGSATTPTFRRAWPYATAIGDTFVASNFGLGRQAIDFNSVGMYIDNGAALTNYYAVDVLSIDLKTAGQETAQFRFVL